MRTMKMRKVLIIALILMFAGCLTARADEFQVIHEFAGGADDGEKPYGSLIMGSGTLYGMTSKGGDSNLGTIFKINPNGSGFNLLHEFAGYPDDGYAPQGSLIMDPVTLTLYGMAHTGGDSWRGTVFRINPDGTGYNLLHEFAGGADDGRYPYGSLVMDSGTLYGMTSEGGDSNKGTVFRVNSGGTGFTLLHDFAGGADDGYSPLGDLIMDSGTLYGMTKWGGDSNFGTIFKINPDGGGFTLLHEFTGGADDGSRPRGSLMIDSGTLYGMTIYGGTGRGVVFSINADGTGFNPLHKFYDVANGGYPYGSLIMDSGKLYGMANYAGTVFEINPDGTGFNNLHEFHGGVGDGLDPRGRLIMDSGTLYGMTYDGGGSYKGTIFSLTLAGGGEVPELPPGAMGLLFLGFAFLFRKLRLI
ncbi:MAG: choice-of-anchor tandem repeat GloVer-containing protein [Candidatus Omnitrophota bacterium]|nr:choice-of-anchor tandem repeat GloVer-containing protein [Candidatus Omnitrophota bacterium]